MISEFAARPSGYGRKNTGKIAMFWFWTSARSVFRHAKLISDWVNVPGQKRYLLIACDRHQKLRLLAATENIMKASVSASKPKNSASTIATPLPFILQVSD